MHVSSVPPDAIPAHDNLFQSAFWGDFKKACGFEIYTFSVSWKNQTCPLLVLIRKGVDGNRYAYAPRAPYVSLPDEERGLFMEDLARQVRPLLPPDVICVRFDTCWPSPFNDSEYYAVNGQWLGAPRDEIRELRMNYSTSERKLRKAPLDHFCPDTVVIDLRGDENLIMSRMRQTTRNCIRKSSKKGVICSCKKVSWLPEWYAIYADTAKRKGFFYEEYTYFETLLTTLQRARTTNDIMDIRILAAEKDDIPLAGMILGLCRKNAYYLYAGSTPEMRDCMPNYGLQWYAIHLAKEAGCTAYDLLGVPPNDDPRHSMSGLYTFKTGLGGKILHFCGCWDYPYNESKYRQFRNAEGVGNVIGHI